MSKAKLDPYTLRWVVSTQRRRVRRNAHVYSSLAWLLMNGHLDRLSAKARSLESTARKKARKA